MLWDRGGAFVRLDDLEKAMRLSKLIGLSSRAKTNARVILPVTTVDCILRDSQSIIFSMNNHEEIDEFHPVIERFPDIEKALEVFRAGCNVKGTTTSVGIEFLFRK